MRSCRPDAVVKSGLDECELKEPQRGLILRAFSHLFHWQSLRFQSLELAHVRQAFLDWLAVIFQVCKGRVKRNKFC